MRDLLAQSLARQAISGDAIAHHPAGLLATVADLDLMPDPAQMVGARQAHRAGTHHQDAFSGRSAGRDRPTFLEREIAKEAIKRVDRHGLVEELSIAGAFAGVITGAAVRPWKRIVLHVLAPGLFVFAGLCESQPGPECSGPPDKRCCMAAED
jgi:hypothetical protein